MTNEDKVDDEFMEKAAMISMEWIDITPIAKALAEQYQQGFDAGRKQASPDAEQLKAEYQRGRDDFKRKMLAKIDDVRNVAPEVILPKAPIASSITAVKPGRGPKVTDVNRPEGIPSNYEMCRLVLIDADVPMSGSEIRDVVAKRWWPDVPHDWKSSPFGFLGSGKLLKNSDNKFVLPQAVVEAEMAKRQEPPRAAVEPFKPRVPDPGKKLGPPPRADGVSFKHGERTVVLHQREAALAVQLRSAMGKGHLDAKFLANSIGIKNEAEMTIKEFAAIMNPKLEKVGLSIDFYKGFGFSMKELA